MRLVPQRAAIPLWLKWFVGLGALTATGVLCGPILGTELWLTCVGWVLFVSWALFPGPSRQWPRLFVLAAILWAVAIPIGALVLVLDVAVRGWRGVLTTSLYPGIPDVVMLLPIGLYAGLLWSLLRRRPVFRVLVVLDAFTSILLGAAGSAHEQPGDGTATLRIVLDVGLTLAVAAYLLWRFRPATDGGEAAPTALTRPAP